MSQIIHDKAYHVSTTQLSSGAVNLIKFLSIMPNKFNLFLLTKLVFKLYYTHVSYQYLDGRKSTTSGGLMGTALMEHITKELKLGELPEKLANQLIATDTLEDANATARSLTRIIYSTDSYLNKTMYIHLYLHTLLHVCAHINASSGLNSIQHESSRNILESIMAVNNALELAIVSYHSICDDTVTTDLIDEQIPDMTEHR